MAYPTLKRINSAIRQAGIPLELERGEGYHYFIYDRPDLNIYETESVYVPYTSIYTVAEWVREAQDALATIEAVIERRS